MKYFIDTEFMEGFHKPVLGKRRHFIDLISIGIVCEDGRELYLISNEYNYNNADDWVKKNVVDPMYIKTVSGDARNSLKTNNFHKHFGLSNKEIAVKIERFCTPITFQGNDRGKPEFYGYYADYDWVLFCSLFGRMIDLPKEFPMYCRDLKQMLDESYIHQINKYPNETRLESWLKTVKNNPYYPKQENEHNALDDAKWNYALYKFLNNAGNLIAADYSSSVIKESKAKCQ